MTTDLALLPTLKNRLRHAWIILHEAITAFLRNDGLRQASSLAYATTLALIPVLLLLTYALTVGIGSSKLAMQKTTEFVSGVIPHFGEVILKEVAVVAKHKKSAGFLNVFVLLWALTPLVGGLRSILNNIFKEHPKRPFWATKLMDLGMAALLVFGIALITGMEVLLTFLHRELAIPTPAILNFALPMAATILLLFSVYRAFSPKIGQRDLFVGAATTTFLWFLLKPSFALFLTYDHNFGMTFGSFKAIFVVIIWIYYSMAVLIFGAEVMAALHREETTLIRRLMKGKRSLSVIGGRRFVEEYPPDTVLFREGETGSEMFYVLDGAISIQRGGVEIAVIGKGGFFGEMSCLLGMTRSADAIAVEDCQCLLIHEHNLRSLMQEYPDIIRDMLVELAKRLKATNERKEHG